MLTNLFSDKQMQCIREPLHEINILSGVTGSGKSYVANIIWYDYICNVAPKDSILIQSGNTSESLYDNVTKQLLEFDRGINWLEYRSEQHRTRLFCKRRGVEVACLGASDESAKDRIHGKNIAGWYGDEITLQPKSFVQMAMSRCRYSKGGTLKSSPIIWTCNPDAPIHYIKTKYIDSRDLDVKHWIYGFKDNPLVDDAFIENQKKKYSGVFSLRMIEGQWAMAEGIVYDNFNPREHIIKTYPENQIVEWTIGYDWGFIHPLVLLLIGTDSEGIDYVVDELYCQNQLIDQALKFKIEEKGWFKKKISSIYGSPERPEFIYQLQQLLGIDTIPADNEVLEGIHEVHKKLNKREDGKYGLYSLESNIRLNNEMQTYCWKQTKEAISKDEPLKINDDGVDALRYNLYSRRRSFDNMFSDAKMSMALQPDEQVQFEKALREL